MDESAPLRRRLWMLRFATVPWLGLVLGPMLLDMKQLLEPLAMPSLYFGFLLPGVALHLGASVLCRKRAGLLAVMVWGALLFMLTVYCGYDALADASYAGWSPVVWAGLVALSQLSIVVAAWRARLVAPPAGGASRYLGAFAVSTALFLAWWAGTPTHGWGGHRGTSESRAIGDVRRMIMAQEAYRTSNGGFHDVPECLVSPQRCIPDYPKDAPPFIESMLGQATVVTSGYQLTFHPGPPAEPAAVRERKASTSSLASYAYVAMPLVFRRTGVRAFCGDGSGRICYTSDGSTPRIEQGLCAAACTTLE